MKKSMSLFINNGKTSCDICDKLECNHQKIKEKLANTGSLRNSSFKQNNRNSVILSPFIKQGEFKDEVRKEDLDKVWQYDDFKAVKKGKNVFLLGTGTYNFVYLALNQKDNKHYAIKEVSKQKLKQYNGEKQFKNEINI